MEGPCTAARGATSDPEVALRPKRDLHLGQMLFGVVNNERFDHLGHSHLAALGGDASFAALRDGELANHAGRRPNFLVQLAQECISVGCRPVGDSRQSLRRPVGAAERRGDPVAAISVRQWFNQYGIISVMCPRVCIADHSFRAGGVRRHEATPGSRKSFATSS
jgi:hypothetical protein